MIGTIVTASGLPQIRTLGYCCQLIGGVLVEQCPTRSEVGRRLLVVSAQLSHCRTVLRLFDDLAMFVYTKQYGLGTEVTGCCRETGIELPEEQKQWLLWVPKCFLLGHLISYGNIGHRTGALHMLLKHFTVKPHNCPSVGGV